MANVFIGFGLLRCSHQGSDLIPFLDLATRASSRMTPSHISHHYPVGDPWVNADGNIQKDRMV
jgi:hypothetical protein